MDNIYVVMPAYNEAESIESVVDSWYAVLEGKGGNSRLVVADSGSTDNTHELLIQLQQKYPRLEILSDTRKEHGPKVIALYDHAIKNGADYIFQTDSDGQTNPDEFHEFWKLRNKYDAVIGKRVSRGDGKARDLVEKVLCVILYLYYRVSVQDANAPFRLMKSELVKKYLEKLPADYELPNVMLTTYFVYYKEPVKFVDITFAARQNGVNSVNMKRIIKTGWRAISDFYRLRKNL